MIKKILVVVMVLFLVLVLALTIYTNQPRGESRFIEAIKASSNTMKSWDQNGSQTAELLRTYNPKIYLASGSYFPMDFYNEILPNAKLMESGYVDKELSTSVDRDMLVTYKNDPNKYIDLQVPYDHLLTQDPNGSNGKAYGRIYESQLHLESQTLDLLFLKYTYTYPYSGLPENTSLVKKWSSRLIGDLMAWHELDIHGATHVVLRKDTMKPIAVVLAQHNHHRVYLEGRDFTMPPDQRIEIVIAKYSNEPYLVHPDRAMREERVIGNPMNLDYLFGRTDQAPFTGGMDYIPAIENALLVDTPVALLPLDDPLYTTNMSLGDRSKVWGLIRTFYLEGPPGADYYTMPALSDLSDLMTFWNIDGEEDLFFELFDQAAIEFFSLDADLTEVLAHQRIKLENDLREWGHIE